MAEPSVRLEPLDELAPARIAALLLEGRAEGFAFLDRLLGEWSSGVNRFDRPGELLLVATSPATGPVGIGGLNVDPFLDDPAVARIRHVFVRATERRKGVGASLVRALIAHARTASFERIRLRTDAPEAGRFYASLGFTICEGSPTATHELRL